MGSGMDSMPRDRLVHLLVEAEAVEESVGAGEAVQQHILQRLDVDLHHAAAGEALAGWAGQPQRQAAVDMVEEEGPVGPVAGRARGAGRACLITVFPPQSASLHWMRVQF